MQIQITKTYHDWENNLRDLVVRARIQGRIARLAAGNPGQHRVLTGGVCELKLDFGAGYRVYYTQHGTTLIVLLAGGDKSSQRADIQTALALANNL
jgi:putative addiction module killer protein